MATVSMPRMVQVQAMEIKPPPASALLQRKLIGLIDESAVLAHEKYTRASGLVYYDTRRGRLYESRPMRGLFYAIGGADALLDIALEEWNATTRVYNDGVVRRDHDPLNPMYMAQLPAYSA